MRLIDQYVYFFFQAEDGIRDRDVLEYVCSSDLARIKAKGGWVSFDLNLREQMWADKQQMRTIIEQQCMNADILKLSDEELLWLADDDSKPWQQALKALQRFPAPLKIITRGKQGGVVIYQDKTVTFPGYIVVSIDTTGAGDAFMAGLLAWLARHGMPEFSKLSPMISQASACGALATTRKGAIPALPTPVQLNHFLNDAGLLSAASA